MFTLYHDDLIGNPGNCFYPHNVEVTDANSLIAAIGHDNVCAEYRNSYRNVKNFIAIMHYVLCPTGRLTGILKPVILFTFMYDYLPLCGQGWQIAGNAYDDPSNITYAYTPGSVIIS